MITNLNELLQFLTRVYVHRSGNPMPLNDDVEYEPLEPIYWEIRATSKDGNLVVAFYRKDDLYESIDDMDSEWFITIARHFGP